MSNLTQRQAINKLWEKGILHWKLHSAQKEMYDFFNSNNEKITVFLCSRRFGKSFLSCLMAIETCIKKPNAIVKYLCPTQRQVQTIIGPIIREIIEQAPKSVRPTFRTKDGVYSFPNGSTIQMAGTDAGNIERIRGGNADLCIIDEAGFCDQLTYGINSVLMPTTLHTNGKILLISTPSPIAAHEFHDFVRNASMKNTLIRKTIFENPLLNQATIDQTIESYNGGIKNPEFKREYLCEIQNSADSTIIPEFDDEVEKEVVKDYKRPPYFDYYLAADVGFVDYTVVLFAYLDFKEHKVVIEDELVLNKATTQEIADKIKDKENKLLVNEYTNERIEPTLRVMDNNLFVINDLNRLHGLSFLATEKYDLETAVNNTRLLVGAKQVIINPRCTTLVKHLKHGHWNKSDKKRQFARSADNGHYDALAALIYLLRNVNFDKSPYPSGFEYRGMGDRFDRYKKSGTAFNEKLGALFKIKKSI